MPADGASGILDDRVRSTPDLARAFDRCPGNQGCREVAIVESDRDVIQPEGEPPYHHVRARVDIQPGRHLWWCRHAGYFANLLPWPLPLLKCLGVEPGKAEASVLPVVRSRDGYPDVAFRAHDGPATLAGGDQPFAAEGGERAARRLPGRVVLRR